MSVRLWGLALPRKAGAGRSQGLLLALGATLCWSTTGLFIQVLSDDYHFKPVALSFWRSLLVVLLLGGLLWRQQGRAGFALDRREIGLLALNGLIGNGLFSVCWSSSVQVNGAAVATTLLYSSPVFVALGGWLLLKERIGGGQVVAIAACLAGCALVAGVYDPATLLSNPQGGLLGLATGLTFGWYTLSGKLITRHTGLSGLGVLFYSFLFSLVLLTVWGLAESGPALVQPHLDLLGWGLLVVLTYGPTLGGYALYNRSLHYLPVAVASLITTLEQPIACLLAWVIFGRGLTPVQWLGGALVLSGVILLQSGLFSRSGQPDQVLLEVGQGAIEQGAVLGQVEPGAGSAGVR